MAVCRTCFISSQIRSLFQNINNSKPDINTLRQRNQSTAELLSQLSSLQNQTKTILETKEEAENTFQDSDDISFVTSEKQTENKVNSARELRFRLDARFPIREEDCNDDDYLKLGLPFNPKKHPGVVNRKTVSLPEDLVKKMATVSMHSDLQQLTEASNTLMRQLWARRIPPDPYQIEVVVKEKIAAIRLERKSEASVEALTDSEEKQLIKSVRKEVKQKSPWEPRLYESNYDALKYMVGAAPRDYAVTHQIFAEIKKRFPLFAPTNLLDFGSGVGTVTWAANQFWHPSLKEHFCVDVSPIMTEISLKLMMTHILPEWGSDLVDFNQSEKNRFKGVFVRSYLPASMEKRYQLATSCFTLLDLPSTEERLKAVELMWLKLQPHGFLVLAENGSKAGFNVVQEARDFIASSCSHAEAKFRKGPRNKDNKGATSFIKARHRVYGRCETVAPCPHSLACPLLRQNPNRALCAFTVKYLPVVERRDASSPASLAKYSYVVLQKLPTDIEKTSHFGPGATSERHLLSVSDSSLKNQQLNSNSSAAELEHANEKRLSSESEESAPTSKSPSDVPNPSWPRVLQVPQARKRHVHTSLCLPVGRVDRKVFTRNHDTRQSYYLAKFSQWGDVVPFEVEEVGAGDDEKTAEEETANKWTKWKNFETA